MADAGATLYIPIDAERTYLAVAHPEARVEGRASPVPSQLVAAAVAGQAGLEALVNAGRLSGRLVLVDPATAKAIKAGAMVTDKAGDMLAVIRGSSGGFSGLTRIKPLSGGLVKSAAAGPAMLSAIAMQQQLARVEKSISEVRDAVDAVNGVPGGSPAGIRRRASGHPGNGLPDSAGDGPDDSVPVGPDPGS
jgi:hypothetical protein